MQLGLKFCNPSLQLLDHWGNLLLSESLVNMLRAVHVPCIDLKEDSSLDFAWVGSIAKLFQKFGVIFNNAERAPKLDATTACVVHQEDKRFRILRDVSKSDVVTIASKVCKPQRLFIDNFEEAWRPPRY